MTQNSPPLVLPPGLSRAIAALQDKDRHRLDDAVTRLHTVNGRLWDTEDRGRGALLSAAQVADCKREIDQLNAERNALAERADEVLGALVDAGRADAPLHTETLATVVDRLSVLTLRIWHSERAAARDELTRRRVPALHGQREELCAALDTLVSDVVAGRRRLPAPARFKLYGRDDPAPAEIKPSRHLRRVLAFGGLSECGKSTSAEFVHRTCGAQRFKIGFLLRQTAHREGLADPYALSAQRQAELPRRAAHRPNRQPRRGQLDRRMVRPGPPRDRRTRGHRPGPRGPGAVPDDPGGGAASLGPTSSPQAN
ncbi:DUF4254 domain-containing protein [Streptomyces sp. NPDC088557]|uniref:DUF4254 domain-containing protein n=1 Tax=Streptomyces sp. NPDC088557 TaxID=3365867 RepID=UPI0038308B65